MLVLLFITKWVKLFWCKPWKVYVELYNAIYWERFYGNQEEIIVMGEHFFPRLQKDFDNYKIYAKK